MLIFRMYALTLSDYPDAMDEASEKSNKALI